MSGDMTRRKFLSNAAFCAAMTAGGLNINKVSAEAGKLISKRSLLFGAGMIWAKWLNREWDYDKRQMDLMNDLGVTITSASFDWVDLQKEKGKWDWAYADHTVRSAYERGIKQKAYLGNTAVWALPEGVKPEHSYRNPPRDECEKDFYNYCKAVATRYKGKVNDFQFWNEPNGCSWVNDGCSNGDPASIALYVRWLKVAYAALKEGNPKCRVIAGALDYHSGVTEGYKYIEGMYHAGAKGHFDGISIHPYGDPLHWKAIADTHRVMKENGDGGKPVSVTEYGWVNSKGPDAADKLRTVLTGLNTDEYSYVDHANYLCITDLPIEGSEQYGLADRELNPRPIALAFKELAKSNK